MITQTEPNVATTGRYGITQAAELLGISRVTLTNWVNSGKIKCGFRRINGRKFFLGSEIQRCWKAQLL